MPGWMSRADGDDYKAKQLALTLFLLKKNIMVISFWSLLAPTASPHQCRVRTLPSTTMFAPIPLERQAPRDTG